MGWQNLNNLQDVLFLFLTSKGVHAIRTAFFENVDMLRQTALKLAFCVAENFCSDG
jgi:hypothetical protein